MIEILYNQDHCIEKDVLAIAEFGEWYKETTLRDQAVCFSASTFYRFWNWLEANDSKMWFTEDGELDSIEGLPDEIVNLVKEIVEVKKSKERYWVKIEFDAFAVDGEYVESAVRDALEQMRLDTGSQDISVEEYD